MVQRLCLPNGTWMMDWDLGEKATFHSCAPPGITDDPNMMVDEQNFKYVSSNVVNQSVMICCFCVINLLLMLGSKITFFSLLCFFLYI